MKWTFVAKNVKNHTLHPQFISSLLPFISAPNISSLSQLSQRRKKLSQSSTVPSPFVFRLSLRLPIFYRPFAFRYPTVPSSSSISDNPFIFPNLWPSLCLPQSLTVLSPSSISDRPFAFPKLELRPFAFPPSDLLTWSPFESSATIWLSPSTNLLLLLLFTNMGD